MSLACFGQFSEEVMSGAQADERYIRYADYLVDYYVKTESRYPHISRLKLNSKKDKSFSGIFLEVEKYRPTYSWLKRSDNKRISHSPVQKIHVWEKQHTCLYTGNKQGAPRAK